VRVSGKKYVLTAEHEAQLKPWAEKWIKNAMSCKAMDDSDRTAMVSAINGLYSSADLEQPKTIAFVKSPLAAKVAAGIIAGVIFLREKRGMTPIDTGGEDQAVFNFQK
jgi:hypothetical protein